VLVGNSGGFSVEGELTSSAQELPAAGSKEAAAAFIVFGVEFDSGLSGAVIRSAREPPVELFEAIAVCK